VTQLSLGVLARSRKENEYRLPLHPLHFERIDEALLSRTFLEHNYGEGFDVHPEELGALVGGFRSRQELIDECDIILLPKPLDEDLAELREGQILWGWPHCVQQEGITQQAIDRRLTLIAWEAMNHWRADGSFGLHVFHKNNEMAGYCSVIHALQLRGTTGEYGRKLNAGVIGFGATGRGAVSALTALGVNDVAVLTSRDTASVESPIHSVELFHYARRKDDPGRIFVDSNEGEQRVVQFLAGFDIIVNCVLQDPDDPLMFVMDDERDLLRSGVVVVDVSCDEGMAFEWARPTSFEEPMFTVGDGVHYYAVDHSPSYLWNSATWEIGEALLPHLGTVMAGPEAWSEDETIRRAIEIRDGVIQNDKILSFQNRSPAYPHEKQSKPEA
jgi:alanine dehydrogenase